VTPLVYLNGGSFDERNEGAISLERTFAFEFNHQNTRRA
jgi:hypothetical protein